MGASRLWAGLALGLALAAHVSVARAQHGPAPTRLDCSSMDCAGTLPGAVRFDREEGRAFETGLAADGSIVGWVALSNEIVDVPAYSGRPVVVLVGLDREGRITGAGLVHHSEPILLTGIPESELVQFIAYYRGHSASERISVGSASREGELVEIERTEHETGHTDVLRMSAVDAISGATVTALATNHTVLETARRVGRAVGVIEASLMHPGHFVGGDEAWTWARMESEGVFGRLVVTQEAMGLTGSAPFVDLWFTLADSPAIGRGLIPRGDYDHLIAQLAPGEHIVVVLGNGTSSFKGSAFVRGGIFDRVRVEQELTEVTFRDTDYMNLPRVAAPDAPRFSEGAAFITRSGHIDPSQPFELVFLGSYHDARGAFSREFRSFEATHRLPSSVYFSEEVESDRPIWEQAFRNRAVEVTLLSAWLLFVIGIFLARRYTFGSKKRLLRLHLATMIVSFLLVGVGFRAQPSVTQMLTLVGGLVHGETRGELFLTEPMLFVLWIFIAVTSLVWGRGVFCGWICPYGIMSELTRKLGALLKIPLFELPESVHGKLRYLRYLILAVLIGTFLVSPALGEQMAEVEPFKSTFLVPFWNREAWFIAWWALLFATSLVMWRPFCRYLCPMGAGLALFGSLRFAGPMRRQYCSSCKICARGCEPRAIRPDGVIDPRECLNCMECEATYNDEKTCPPLIGIERLLSKRDRTQRDDEKLAHLQKEKERLPWRPA